ncbi:hypothetical protein ALQ41_03388, partial [Pseudomonas savastanoi pv. glycinea]
MTANQTARVPLLSPVWMVNRKKSILLIIFTRIEDGCLGTKKPLDVGLFCWL